MHVTKYFSVEINVTRFIDIMKGLLICNVKKYTCNHVDLLQNKRNLAFHTPRYYATYSGTYFFILNNFFNVITLISLKMFFTSTSIRI